MNSLKQNIERKRTKRKEDTTGRHDHTQDQDLAPDPGHVPGPDLKHHLEDGDLTLKWKKRDEKG